MCPSLRGAQLFKRQLTRYTSVGNITNQPSQSRFELIKLVPSGLIPVPVRPPHTNNISTTLPTVKMVIDVSKSRAVLTTHNIAKALRSKEAVGVVDIKSWPTVVEVDDAPKKKLMNPLQGPPHRR